MAQPDCTGVPAAGAEPPEQGLLRGLLVQVERLRIELAGEVDDRFPREGIGAEVDGGADLEILEIAAHRATSGARRRKSCAASQVITTSPFWLSISKTIWHRPTQ